MIAKYYPLNWIIKNIFNFAMFAFESLIRKSLVCVCVLEILLRKF